MIKPWLILLAHWLRWVEKCFSKCLSQVQVQKTASSNNLLASNSAFENRTLFLVFQIAQVTAIHQYRHLLLLKPSAWIEICCRKFCLGPRGKAVCKFSQDIDSHQIGWIKMQWKNKWDASSKASLQKGHCRSCNCTCLLCRFILVGSLSSISLQAKTEILLGILIFHNSLHQSCCWPPLEASKIRL